MTDWAAEGQRRAEALHASFAQTDREVWKQTIDAHWSPELVAMLQEPWPTDEELDSIMLEDAGPEPLPVRNRDHSAAQRMSPRELIQAARKQWHADFDVQIETLQRLIRRCEALVWPVFG